MTSRAHPIASTFVPHHHSLQPKQYTMPKFAANLSMMYTEHPFLDRFEAAAKDGFKAVEFFVPLRPLGD